MGQRSTTAVRIFAFGVAAGVLIAAIMVSLAGFMLLHKGATVKVARESVIDEVSAEMIKVMQAVIPQAITQVREQLPQTVSQQVKSGLSEISLEIGSYQVKLPAAVVSRIDGYLQSTVVSVFGELLSNLESNASQIVTVEQLRLRAAEWIKRLDGQTLNVQIAWGMKLPITIRLE